MRDGEVGGARAVETRKGAAGNGRKRHEKREEGSAKANGLSRGEQIRADKKKRKKRTREKKRAWGRTEKRE
jgi:hypothetical protein